MTPQPWKPSPGTEPPGHHAGELRGVLPGGQTAVTQLGSKWFPLPFEDAPDRPGGTWAGPEGQETPPQPEYLYPACSCGWEGQRIPYDATGDGLAYEADGRTHYDGAGNEAAAAWRGHLTALTAADFPDHARAQLTELEAMLRELATERPRAALAFLAKLEQLGERAELAATATGRLHGTPWDVLAADRGRSRQAHTRRYTHPAKALATKYADSPAFRLLAENTAGRPRDTGPLWPELTADQAEGVLYGTRRHVDPDPPQGDVDQDDATQPPQLRDALGRMRKRGPVVQLSGPRGTGDRDQHTDPAADDGGPTAEENPRA